MRQPQNDRNRTMVLFALGLLVLFATPVGAQDRSRDDRWDKPDRWNFDLSVYGWLATTEGKLNYDIPGVGDTLEVDPGDIIDDLQFVAMLGFQARKNKWSAFVDVVYADIDGSKDSSVPSIMWKEAKKDKKAEEKKGMFDKELMVKLENLGRKMGADPSSWRTEIPSAYSFSRD